MPRSLPIIALVAGALVGPATVLDGAEAPAPAPAGSTVATMNITLEGARRVLDAALSEARHRGVGGAFAVVDAGGHLVALERLDGTFAAAAHVSVDKARTSAMFLKPTRIFEEVVRNGRTAMVAIDDFTPLQGAVPIMVDGVVVGALGVSGASSAAEDDELAVIGAAALDGAADSMAMSAAMTVPTEPLHLESAAVREAFARGMPLLENASYKIHASRRESGGLAETHTDETDIFYVLEGDATFVTGGRVVNGRETAPHEIRGPSIEGGQTRALRAGDVMVVPAGTPHWFKSVDRGPMLYFVVKVVS